VSESLSDIVKEHGKGTTVSLRESRPTTEAGDWLKSKWVIRVVEVLQMDITTAWKVSEIF
jgi:hypothetical protein